MKPKKTEEQLSNSDKIDAIYEMLPLIKEAYNICQFMLENRWFNTAYKWYMDRDSEKRRTEEMFTVLDYYGISHEHEKNVVKLAETHYMKQEHIDTICKYLALEWISYDRDDFILVKLPHDKK